MLRSLALLVPLALPVACVDEGPSGGTLAAAQLAVAGGALSAAVADTGEVPIQRRVAGPFDANTDLSYGDVSPDGRLLSFVDWLTGDLAMMDLGSGTRINVSDRGGWDENGGWAEFSAFSPDGERIAYLWGEVEEVDDAAFRYQIRISEARAGDAGRVIYELGDEEDMVSPTDWGRLGILVERSFDDGTSELGFMDPETGSVRVVTGRAPRGQHAHGAELSPDERFIAFETESGVVLVRAADGSETGRLEGARLLGWSGDGDGLIVHATVGGRSGAAHVSLEDGRPLGSPRLLRGELYGVEPVGASIDGRYFYSLTVEVPRVHVAAFDPATGSLLSAPEPVAQGSGGSQRGEWSPDGATLAYIQTPFAGRGPRQIMLRSTSGDAVRHLVTVERRVQRLFWHPRGDAIYFMAHDGEGVRALFRVRVRDGAVSDAPIATSISWPAAFSPDGRTFYARKLTDEAGPNRVVAIDVGDGTERTAWQGNASMNTISVSPDGGHLILGIRDGAAGSSSFITLPAGGGEQRELVSIAAPGHVWGMDGSSGWVDGGDEMLFFRREAGGHPELWAVGLEGEPRRIATDITQEGNLRISPDGRTVALDRGRYRAEVWVLEDVAAALADR